MWFFKYLLHIIQVIHIEELEKMLHNLKETIQKPHIRKKKTHHTHQTTTFWHP